MGNVKAEHGQNTTSEMNTGELPHPLKGYLIDNCVGEEKE
jgi:hypothetical protein